MATTCNSAVWAALLSLVLCLCSCQDRKQSHNDGGTYARLTASERKAADSALTVAAGVNRDVKYYLRTHNVLDNGFDIVATFEKEYKKHFDSLARRSTLMERVVAFLALDLQQCTAPPLCLDIHKAPLEHIHSADGDSIGHYQGTRNVAGQPSGYGIFRGCNGSYYEGEWLAGMRYGVGLQVTPGKRLKLGEWKEDKFLGERITYTPDRTYGIDISRYQHEQVRMVTRRVRGRRGRYITRKVKQVEHYNINWSALRITSLGTYSKKKIVGEVDYPVSFIYIKSTEGTTVRNAYFASDYVNSKKHGYKTGAYHFFSVRTTGKAQGLYFLQNSRYEKGDLPPVLDVEIDSPNIVAKAKEWWEIVEERCGVNAIIYTNMHVYTTWIKNDPMLSTRDLWLAKPRGEMPVEPNCLFWQLSHEGHVWGIIDNMVDINLFNGTQEELQDYIQLKGIKQRFEEQT